MVARVLLIGLLLALAGQEALAQGTAEGRHEGVRFSGDLRFGWYAEQRRPRMGGRQRSDEGRTRVRIAVDAPLAEGWSARGRLAASAGTDNGPDRFHLSYAGAAALGDATFDQLYLQYRSGDWRVTLGRFSSGFALRQLAGKSLDRQPASNVAINWTDGVQVERGLGGGWSARALLQYQDRDGPGQPTQAPLDYSRSSSRVGSWFALVAEPDGLFEQRSLSLTWLPNALAKRGIADPSRQDYLALNGKLALAWPLGEGGTRLVVSSEAGYAPNRPRHEALNTGRSGEAGGLAWQLSANLYDIAPGHSLTLVYGQADAGWLLSPDYRPNDTLAEVRYQWRFSPSWSMEARYRLREERQVPATALREREDRDFYVRFSGRF